MLDVIGTALAATYTRAFEFGPIRMAVLNASLLGTLISWFFVALLAIAALKLAFWVFGAALGIGTWLLFTVGPILLVGWLIVKIFRALSRPRDYSAY